MTLGEFCCMFVSTTYVHINKYLHIYRAEIGVCVSCSVWTFMFWNKNRLRLVQTWANFRSLLVFLQWLWCFLSCIFFELLWPMEMGVTYIYILYLEKHCLVLIISNRMKFKEEGFSLIRTKNVLGVCFFVNFLSEFRLCLPKVSTYLLTDILSLIEAICYVDYQLSPCGHEITSI